MATTDNFDRFFLNFPPQSREDDFDLFWENAFKQLKKNPIEPSIEKSQIQTSPKFVSYSITYSGYGRYSIHGELHLPSNKNNPRVLILVPDYNRPFVADINILKDDIAYLFLQLRGHELLSHDTPADQKEGRLLPGFMAENILGIENYYVKYIYLDIFRSIEALRLVGKVDCGGIGLYGKGLGGAASVFCASFSNRISAIVLDTPSFCYLDLSQNLSTCDSTKEINLFLSEFKSKKEQVKKNLSYFDAVNFADKIKCPAMAVVGLRDTLSPPECVFALFNHLLCEKTIEVYPEDDNHAGGKDQLLKSISWLKNQIL